MSTKPIYDASMMVRSHLTKKVKALTQSEPESFSYLFDRSGFFQFTFRGQAVTGPTVVEAGMEVAMRSLGELMRTGQCDILMNTSLKRIVDISNGTDSELAILVKNDVEFPLSGDDTFFLPRLPSADD